MIDCATKKQSAEDSIEQIIIIQQKKQKRQNKHIEKMHLVKKPYVVASWMFQICTLLIYGSKS